MNSNKTSSKLRILLVEDNAHDRMAFCRALQKGQMLCEITECVRAEEALECVRSDDLSFNLLVVDHGLPGMKRAGRGGLDRGSIRHGIRERHAELDEINTHVLEVPDDIDRTPVIRVARGDVGDEALLVLGFQLFKF